MIDNLYASLSVFHIKSVSVYYRGTQVVSSSVKALITVEYCFIFLRDGVAVWAGKNEKHSSLKKVVSLGANKI